MGHRRPLSSTAWSGHHAIRTARQERGEGGRGKGGTDFESSNHLHPDTDLKEELSKTAVQITCFDRDGKEVKRVTSTDNGDIEDNENTQPSNGGGGNTQPSGDVPGEGD